MSINSFFCEGDEFGVANDPDTISLSTASDVTDGPPPNYDEDWNKNNLEEMGKLVF